MRGPITSKIAKARKATAKEIRANPHFKVTQKFIVSFQREASTTLILSKGRAQCIRHEIEARSVDLVGGNPFPSTSAVIPVIAWEQSSGSAGLSSKGSRSSL